MKKSNLWCGLGFIAGGLACALCALLWETALSSLLCGFAGALIAPGTAQVLRYRKWSRPENAEAYREKLEQEAIELRDERKELLRNKSGRYAYVLGLALCSASILAFSILGALGVVAEHRLIVLFLSGFLMVQLLSGWWFDRLLSRKY